MHPLLFEHPPITAYGAMIVIGIVAAWLLARHLGRRVGIAPHFIDVLLPLLTAAGLIGAWLFGWFSDRTTTDHVHGSVLFGALLVATIAGIGAALLNRVPLGKLGDALAAPVMLGVAFGRIGCFFAGCCYGRVCDSSMLISVSFPRNSFAWAHQLQRGQILEIAATSLPVYPTQLFESAAALLIALLLLAGIPRRRISGEIFLHMAILYAASRFALEVFRADNPAIALGFTFSQLTCMGVLALAGVTFVVRRRYADRWHLRLEAGGDRTGAPCVASEQSIDGA